VAGPNRCASEIVRVAAPNAMITRNVFDRMLRIGLCGLALSFAPNEWLYGLLWRQTLTE